MIPNLWVNKHNSRRGIIILLNKINLNYMKITKNLKTPRENPINFWNYDLSWVSLLCEFIICACELWIRNFKWEIPSWDLSNAIWHASIWNNFIIILSFNVHESNLPIWLLFIFLGYNLTLRFPNGKYEPLFFLHLHLETFPMI
jgi:hypothetical protein